MASNIIKKVVPVASMGLGAALTGTFTIYTTKDAKVLITRAWLSIGTALSGGAAATATISIGKSGSVTKYLGATDVFTGASGDTLGTTAGLESRDTAIIGTLTTTVGNTNVLTAGEVTFFIELSALP